MQMLVFLVLSALTVVPLFKLLPGYRINPWWALVALFPIGLIVLLWVMASRAEE